MHGRSYVTIQIKQQIHAMTNLTSDMTNIWSFSAGYQNKGVSAKLRTGYLPKLASTLK